MRLPVRQLAIAASIAIVVLVALSFARVIIIAYQLNVQKEALEGDVQRLRSENQALQTRVADLQTDAAVEKLARQELGWARRGDTVVVVIQRTPTVVATAVPITRETPTPRSAWQRLWNVVTGGGAPDHSRDGPVQ